MADLKAVFERFIEEAVGKHPVVSELRKRLDDLEQDPDLQDISERVEELEKVANIGPQLKQYIASELHDLLLDMITSAAGVEATEERVEEIEAIVEEVEEVAEEAVEQAEEEVENPPELEIPSQEEIPLPLNPEPAPEDQDIPPPSAETLEEEAEVPDWAPA